ncbi:MAG: hypothetical protein NC341_08250 [Blautia sp.]|nr:hypothetical protein [Blautia sp.]MCM1201383.1 hypothetical protein [Bacteroides fragilis]
MQDDTKQTEAEENIARYTIKNSVFSDLFKMKKYLLQLYRALHPEDVTATEDGLTDITIRNVLTDNLYHDLGFSLGEKIFIPVEVQSVWTLNIIIRALLYLAQTCHDYLNARIKTYTKVCITLEGIHHTGPSKEKIKNLHI